MKTKLKVVPKLKAKRTVKRSTKRVSKRKRVNIAKGTGRLSGNPTIVALETTGKLKPMGKAKHGVALRNFFTQRIQTKGATGITLHELVGKGAKQNRWERWMVRALIAMKLAKAVHFEAKRAAVAA